MLEFGSRSGSWFALCLFVAIFGGLGWGIAREIRLRSQGPRRWLGIVVGLAFLAGPISAVYASSLSGFYEAVVVGPSIRLYYLLPGIVSEIPLSSISDVRAVPWYRLRWRLIVTTSSGGKYESATSGRASVMESVVRLNDYRVEATGGESGPPTKRR
jgi:hypothetical protein